MLIRLLIELRNLLHDKLKDRYTDKELVMSINNALIYLANHAYYFRKIVSLPINNYQVTLPDDFIKLFYVQYKDNFIEFISKTDLHIRNYYSACDEGEIQWAVMDGNENNILTFYPNPSPDFDGHIKLNPSNNYGSWWDLAELKDLKEQCKNLEIVDNEKYGTYLGFENEESESNLGIVTELDEIVLNIVTIYYARKAVLVDENIEDNIDYSASSLEFRDFVIDSRVIPYIKFYVLKELLLADKDTNSIGLSQKYEQLMLQELSKLKREAFNKHSFSNTNGEYRYATIFNPSAYKRRY